MFNDHPRRLTSLREPVLVLIAASLLALALAAPALAAPTGDFEVFSQCPTGNPELTFCFYGTSTGGEFDINGTKVPIKETVTLQGGSILNEETGAETFVDATGETLSRTPQQVPGGLLGIIAPESLPKAVQEIINKLVSEGLAGVTATAELVSTPAISRRNLLAEEEVALALPVRIKLSNTLLGNKCYIGSKSNPVKLQLTTGLTSPPPPNEPISGRADTSIELKDEFQLVVIRGNKLVDNSYSVPGVSGCGGLLSLVLDPAIDLKLGLPAAAGKNAAILESNLENATASAVKASE